MADNLTQLTLLHAVGAELHTGMFVMATGCVIMRVFADAYTNVLAPRMPQWLGFVDRLIRWLVPYLDRASLIAMIGGVASVFVSIGTGFYVWENGRAFDVGILQNKIIFSTMALTLWVSAIVIRLRFTDFLWLVPRLSNLYVLVVAGAMGFTIFAGALGARLSWGHCFFDPLFERIGWDPANSIATAPIFSLIMVALGVLFLVGYFRISGAKMLYQPV